MKLIDDAAFEVDGGYGDSPPYEVKAWITLIGDIGDECANYLEHEEADALVIEIGRTAAEKLHTQLTEALYG